jgi:ubiquitin fusion degradation protein 1
MFGLFNFNDPSRSQFEANYRVYPVTFLDKPEAEAGDKIFLPPSALDRLGALDLLRTGAVDEQAGLAFHSLAVERQSIETPQYWHPFLTSCVTFACHAPTASLHIDYPMLFKLENRATGRTTHCGVLEFIADEGMAYLPYWVRPPCRLHSCQCEGACAQLRSEACLSRDATLHKRPLSPV